MSTTSSGVLDASYARDRSQRPEVEFRYRMRARVVSDAVERFATPGGTQSVLDMGCAEGRTMLELRELLGAERIVGVEMSEELIEQQPPLPEGMEILQGDITRLPDAVKAETWDLVSALAVLEHLPDPGAAVAEAARVLRPGGLFVATCPDPRWDAIATRFGLLADDQHESDVDNAWLRELAGAVGLEVLAYERFMFAPVGFLPYLQLRISPDLGKRLDQVVRRLGVLDALFVNQALIARKR